jgi:SAM-dependent methyltransferase
MHTSVAVWVHEHLDVVLPPVLEVGSRNVNGSVRDFCPTPYFGIDIVAGLDVDQVYDGETIPFSPESFATVICTEVFEHARRPWRLAEEILRVLRPGGIALVTARGSGFQYHDPPDRWRFMRGTLSELFMDLGAAETFEEDDPQVPGVFVEVRKPSS